MQSTLHGLEVSPAEAHESLAGPAARLLDVREAWEWQQLRASGAQNIPLGAVPASVRELSRDEDLFLICASGNRSLQAASFLQEQGFTARSVAGGTAAWVGAGLPLER